MDILALLDSLSKKNRDTEDKETWIVACLGNPGKEYEKTRHNAGFQTADLIIKERGLKEKSARRSLEYEFDQNGKRVILVLPQTFMNASGMSVAAEMKFYKVNADHLVVIYDDIDLAPGVIRIRKNGSAGGHNGMKSIIEHIGTQEFSRIRIGVGAKPNAEYNLAAHVLSKPDEEDINLIAAAQKRAIEALPLVMEGKIDEAQSRFCKEK